MTWAEWLFLAILLLVLYTYVIYPMLAVLIGAGRVDRIGDELKPVSLLVPAHNEASVIASKIENFLAIDYPPELVELLILDDGSTDETADIVRSMQGDRIHLIESKRRHGKAAAMNSLVDTARHSLLLFSDANVMLGRGTLRRLVDRMSEANVGAVTGEVRLVGSDREFETGESLYYWLERRIQTAESRIGSVMGVDGGLYLLRRQLFQPLPADTILDDFLVSMNVIRSSHRVIYESAAKAVESGTPTAKQEFWRRVRIAAGAVQLIKRCNFPQWYQWKSWVQFVSHKLLRWFSPLLFIILFIVNFVVFDRHPVYQIILWIQITVASSIILTWFFTRLRRTKLGAILFYFGLSQVAIGYGLLRGLANRQPAQWEKGNRVEDLS